MRITCHNHPSLLVTTPHVEFVDGVADVDEATLAALTPLLEEWGIDAADIGGEHAETSPETTTEPTPSEEETPKRGKNG